MTGKAVTVKRAKSDGDWLKTLRSQVTGRARLRAAGGYRGVTRPSGAATRKTPNWLARVAKEVRRR